LLGVLGIGVAGGQVGVLSGKVAGLVDATLRGMTAAKRKLVHTLLILLGATALSVAATVALSIKAASSAPLYDANGRDAQGEYQGRQSTGVGGTDCRSP